MSNDSTFSSTSPPLSPADYRDELERTLASMIIDGEQHMYLRGERNGYAWALRMLGGYGRMVFDRSWADRVIAEKGLPNLGGVSWLELPGGPLYDHVSGKAEQR